MRDLHSLGPAGRAGREENVGEIRRARRTNTDIHINPASQEIYADFYNGMLGTAMTWQEIFAQTDRDINLQRVMNVMRYGPATGEHDRIPERAMGPTDDRLYEAEQEYHDRELEKLTGKTTAEIATMPTGEKRELLMNNRKEQLRRLIRAYYEERGWNAAGIPTIDTLQRLGLWRYLTGETRDRIAQLQE